MLVHVHFFQSMRFKVAAATFRRPLAGISVSGLRFRCFGHRISKFPAPERWDFNISGSGASGFQDFQLRSVAISIFPASEQLRLFGSQNVNFWIHDPETGVRADPAFLLTPSRPRARHALAAHPDPETGVKF